MENKENTYKESHGSGFISTLIFMVAAVGVMILLRHILNY